MSASAALLWLLTWGGVSGTVRADSTLAPIAYASIEVPGLGRTTTADRDGSYILGNLPAGRWRIRASAPGYRPLVRDIDIPETGTVRLDFVLSPEPVELRGINVEVAGGTDARAGPGAVRMDAATAKLQPSLAEVDVLRAVQALPSVASVSDFSSALYIRGGAPDQNLFLLDDVPVFNPYHLGGLFGAFNPDVVASVDVLAGAFPARWGDRLSSVVDVRTRDGARDRVHASGAVGLLSARAAVDGPLPGRNGSFLASVRRTYDEVLELSGAAYAVGMIPKSIPHGFEDILVKATHEVGSLGSSSATLYADREWLDMPDVFNDVQYDWSWGSRVASLRHVAAIGSSLLATLRLGWSSFGTSLDSRWSVPGPPDLQQTFRARGDMRDALAGADLAWYVGDHTFRAGAQLDDYRLDYDVVRGETPVQGSFETYVPPFRRSDRLRTTTAYLEDLWEPGERIHLRAGVRMLHAGRGLGTAWLPRLGAKIDLLPELSLSLGAGRYAQAIHSIRNEEAAYAGLMAYDVLAAADPGIGLARSEDVVVGLAWSGDSSSIRIDAYAKRMEGLALPPLPADPGRAEVIAVDGFERGTGTVRGLEVLARHRRGLGGVWAAYTLTFAERVLNGQRFTPRFERRHSIDLMGVYPVNRRGSVSARVILATGQPFTPGIGTYYPDRYEPHLGRFLEISGPEVVLLGEHNSARSAGYRRIDIGARYRFYTQAFGYDITLTPYAQVLNLLNTTNPLVVRPSPRRAAPRTQQLPLLITVGLEWRY